MADKKATRYDVSACHSFVVRLERLRKDYNELSEPFRQLLEDEFEAENKFLNLLHHLEITAEDMAEIAEERKSSMIMMDCCCMKPVEEQL